MSRKPSKEEQAAIRAALDAALDDLDVDDSDEEVEEEEVEVEEQAANDGSVDDDEANAEPIHIVDDSKVEKEDAEISMVETSETLPDASVNDSVPETTGRHEAKSALSNDRPPTPVVLDAKLAAAAVEEETSKVNAGEAKVNDPSSPDSQRLESLAAVQNAPPCVVVNPPLPETATATSETPTPTATPVKKSAEEEEDRPFLGPPRPLAAGAPKPAPPASSGGGSKKKKQHASHHAHHHHHHTTDPDKLFMEMMEDMLLTEQEGVTGPDEMMMRLVQQLQDQLHDLEEEVDGDGSDNDDNDDDEEEDDEREQRSATPDVAEPALVGPDPHAVTNEEPVTAPSNFAPLKVEAAPPTEVVVDALPVSSPPLSKVSKVGDTLPAIRSENPDPRQPTGPVPTKSTPPNPPKKSDSSENDTSQAKPLDPAQPKSSSSDSKAASSSSKTTTKRKKAPVRPQSQQKSSSSSTETGGDAQQDLDATISQLIQGMAQQAAMADDGPDDPNDVANGNEEADLLNMLMKGLSGVQGDGAGGGGAEDDDDDFNADAMIDGMMEQLLSKVECAWRLDYMGCCCWDGNSPSYLEYLTW
jgi:Pex19 protein family